MTADVFAADYYLVYDVKPDRDLGNITIGIVQIPREALIKYYVIRDDHGLPMQPMVMPSLRKSSDTAKEPPSAAEAPDVIHLSSPRND